MENEAIVSAYMAAEGEINLILDDLTRQLRNRIDELFQEPDERWVERIQTFTFKNENTLNSVSENLTAKDCLVAARKAKVLMYLQGLNAAAKLKQISEIKEPRCLGDLIARAIDSDGTAGYLKYLR